MRKRGSITGFIRELLSLSDFLSEFLSDFLSDPLSTDKKYYMQVFPFFPFSNAAQKADVQAAFEFFN